MSIRPQASPSTINRRRPCKTGKGHMRADDQALLILADSAKQIGIRPTARAYGISDGPVRRALRIYGVASAFISTHKKHKQIKDT